MSALACLRCLRRPQPGRRPAAVRWPFSARPRLEALEDRVTPTTFKVTPGGTGLGSLAGAIAQANLDQQTDTIVLRARHL